MPRGVSVLQYIRSSLKRGLADLVLCRITHTVGVGAAGGERERGALAAGFYYLLYSQQNKTDWQRRECLRTNAVVCVHIYKSVRKNGLFARVRSFRGGGMLSPESAREPAM